LAPLNFNFSPKCFYFIPERLLYIYYSRSKNKKGGGGSITNV
jgi:hypothetical protein